MGILVINAGSSSLKYQYIDMTNEEVLAKGLCDRIGIEGSHIKHTKQGCDAVTIEKKLDNHKDAIELVISTLTDDTHGVISDMNEIEAVGHRMVHGGEKFSKSTIINDEVMAAFEACIDLAPLHNPANIIGVKACQELMPGTPMVGVFDTAFHQTMPQKEYMYGLPYEYYEKYGVRKYGFHGTSHKYVANRAAELYGKPIEDLKIITCHMGNGSSITAVKGGESVATTMGLTPLAGVLMGTRCGDIDPAVVSFLAEKEGKTVAEMDKIMNKESGVYGVSGVSSDFRDLGNAADSGDERAKLALDMFYYQVRKFVGSYAAVMGGVDLIVFTGGIGENNDTGRAAICADFEYLGLVFDEAANAGVRGVEKVISAADSKVCAMVVPTNEELAIARETKALI